MISCRYINNEVEDIEYLVNYLNNPHNDIKTEDEVLEVVMYLFITPPPNNLKNQQAYFTLGC